ncbi:MAG TPA: 4a-hydroxytetrahydrobiopterin dehydratase [Gammaproteobacteria bacterium]|nr:4a-hydroxytetrahydrobiopterin dehydratase [Gammaproteobacteria bacterium]
MEKLSNKHCLPCEGGVPPLLQEEIKKNLKQLGMAWQVSGDAKKIFKDFKFKNYYQTMAFVNAIAWMAHRENHHPDLEVGYNHCKVEYTTHAADGLTENDFICAHKVEELNEPVVTTQCALK